MKIEIITPERTVNLEESNMLILPTYDGEIGILNGHAPAVVKVKKGQIAFKKEKVMTMVIFNDGYAHITPDKTTIILEDF